MVCIAMLPEFSARTRWDLRETAYAAAARAARAHAQPLLDLTASNPTTCGFVYAEHAWRSALLAAETAVYDPDPRGLLRARAAVAEYYRQGTGAEPGASPGASPGPEQILPEQILLTTSTSEAYSFLFRLLCDPGEEVLIAQPSYPLFDFLGALDCVRLIPYPLFYDHGWHIDLAALRAAITPRTRAVIVVQPNNPTGHFTKLYERHALEALCVKHSLALIVDEVFLDYALEEELDEKPQQAAPSHSFTAGQHPALTFVLSGLSKVAALPQMKVAWILSQGPQPALQEALARLEVIADTFLSMNAPMQYALPAMLDTRHGMQQQIRQRTKANLAALDLQLRQQSLVSRLHTEAGWYAVLRVSALAPDEETAVRLLQQQRVLVHPGSFYGMPAQGWLVVSLLPQEAEFQQGVERLLQFFWQG
jgi:alanine-synthesizing transaminase